LSSDISVRQSSLMISLVIEPLIYNCR